MNADVRVEYYYDPEAAHWGYRVPSLRITGGGARTREQAEEDVRDAIIFALEGDGETDLLPGGEVGFVRVTLDKALQSQPA